MSSPRVVPDDSDVTISATGDISHKCPHVNETDHGRITVTWRVLGKTYELHSLAEYLGSFKGVAMSHEQITDRIRHDLSIADGIELLSVETTWQTARMEVTCGSWPTRADQL